MYRKYRVKSKFRFIVFLAIVFLCIFTAVGSVFGLNNAGGSSMDEYYVVHVSSGDTLWEIASAYGPDHQDIRKTIHEICALNDLTASELHAGQKLLIPVYGQ